MKSSVAGRSLAKPVKDLGRLAINGPVTNGVLFVATSVDDPCLFKKNDFYGSSLRSRHDQLVVEIVEQAQQLIGSGWVTTKTVRLVNIVSELTQITLSLQSNLDWLRTWRPLNHRLSRNYVTGSKKKLRSARTSSALRRSIRSSGSNRRRTWPIGTPNIESSIGLLLIAHC